MKRLVLGTAGHVDHGKTRLVHALTGVDTDRLAEEKTRGITIDLGFARLTGAADVQVAIVDVPGHEAFVRNMLAGATGMDAVLLVIAADEGVMPQTREHAAILDLLGVTHGVVALTKTDLVDDDWRELVREDARSLLERTSLADAELIDVSAETGEGLEELAAALARVAERTPPRAGATPFRLPVDRAFTIRGTGTVVTGTVADGRLRNGATVTLLPAGDSVRVRALQSHGEAVEEVSAGQRAAVALAGLDRDAAGRGDVLVEGDAWRAHGTWTVRLQSLPDAPRALRPRARVRVHLGTAEIMARVALLESAELAPGGRAWAQLRLERPGVSRAGDRFVLRSYSPVTTIGGGTVVEPLAPKRRTLDPGLRAAFESLLDEPVGALRARLELAGWAGAPAATIPVEVPGAALPADGSVLVAGDRWLAARFAHEAAERILAAVDRGHDEAPLSPGLDVAEARRSLPRHAAAGLADAALDALVAAGTVEVGEGVVRRTGYRPRLEGPHAVLRERVASAYRASGLAPTPVTELEDAPAELAWPIVKLLEREGILHPIGGDAYVDAEALGAAAELVRARLAGHEGVQPAAFRDLLGLSRKNLIPLLEHFDRIGVTRRDGSGRTVLPAR